MPEIAEVRRTVDFLNSKLRGNFIMKWKFIKGKYAKRFPIGFESVKFPIFVEEVKCKGKFIYMIISSENGPIYVLHHMMLTGWWEDTKNKNSVWIIETDEKEKLYFRNTRGFATIKFTSDIKILQNHLDKLGPDIMDEKFTEEVWNRILRKYENKNITSFLMDQKCISGCGNYIKSEALYSSGISPLRKVKSLTNNERKLLYRNIRVIPKLAYHYKKINPKSSSCGSDNIFSLKIYKNPKAKQTKTSDGRITYWDPEIQK